MNTSHTHWHLTLDARRYFAVLDAAATLAELAHQVEEERKRGRVETFSAVALNPRTGRAVKFASVLAGTSEAAALADATWGGK